MDNSKMKWNFRQGAKSENPKDAGIKEFSKHIFESVVREATQNAVDNRLDKSKPVRIEFQFGKISKDKIPGFDELKLRWEACLEKWKDQVQYKNMLEAILSEIDSFGNDIPYLTISDFNTKGMDFDSNPDIDHTRYGAFSRGTHSFHDSSSAAGSEGQGKAALYAISAMRTMFVHTISERGSIYEGLTRFAAHLIGLERYNADGYFPHSPIRPAYETTPDNSLPFRRVADELGTSITLVGLWTLQDVEAKMIKAALNNFWMAIEDGELIIKIGDSDINKNSLEELIDAILPERTESNKTKSNPTEYGRVKCYYETWKEINPEVTETYQKEIDVLGKCILRISQHAEYPGKVAFFREQKMLILRSSTNVYMSSGYCGVFHCPDEEGNKILRQMEGKTHTEWDPKLCVTEEDKVKGDKAIKAINEFIMESWQDYRSKHFPDSIELKGLSGLAKKGKSTRGVGSSDAREKKPRNPPSGSVPKPEFEKLGITKNGLKSVKSNGIWNYTLTLDSNSDKSVSIKMYPATDSFRIKESDLLEVIHVSDDWQIVSSSIEGQLLEGENIIEFSLNEVERVAIEFKIINL
jgi:hypothetical protein